MPRYQYAPAYHTFRCARCRKAVDRAIEWNPRPDVTLHFCTKRCWEAYKDKRWRI